MGSTAGETYRERIDRTRNGIARLTEAINDLEEDAAAEPLFYWSWAGNLKRVNEGLADILEPFGLSPEYLARLRS